MLASQLRFYVHGHCMNRGERWTTVCSSAYASVVVIDGLIALSLATG
jgi:hypothetical protein